ncbi:hypothetical protein O181_111679, partial [Austropuccinia psidii MF-1]|nr:hypothetical protein [Austropuccinia psidii MF-1]
MKEGGNVALYISDFRSLVSEIGEWGERALIHHFRKGLASRILDQLASHPSDIDSLQDLMDVSLELDTRYHEGKRRSIIIKRTSRKPQSQTLLIIKINQAQVIRRRIFILKSSILIDSGATHSFIAKQFVHKYSLTTSELPEKIPLIILDSSESPSLFVTHHTKYMVELPSFPSFEWDFLVIDTPKGEDLILGFDFLNHFNPSIDWRQGLITFNADHKDYCDPSKSFHIDFSSAENVQLWL